jgi:uncharacterized RDD family membrane protein YckC
MEIGLRVLALVIDLAVCLGAMPLIFISGSWIMTTFEDVPSALALLFVPLFFASLFLWPLLYFCIPTAIWGRTLGKLICRLKVTDIYDQGPRFWRKLGREALKCLMIVSGIGFTITFILLVSQGSAWYDNLCGTKVEFSSYIRLTKTQKNYRKYMKDRERGDK